MEDIRPAVSFSTCKEEEESTYKEMFSYRIGDSIILNTFKKLLFVPVCFSKKKKIVSPKVVNQKRELLMQTFALYIFQSIVNPNIYYIISKFHYSERLFFSISVILKLKRGGSVYQNHPLCTRQRASWTYLPQVFTSVHLFNKIIGSGFAINSPLFQNNWVKIHHRKNKIGWRFTKLICFF